MYRHRRHFAMVGRETSSFVSTARAETPSARSSTIRKHAGGEGERGLGG